MNANRSYNSTRKAGTREPLLGTVAIVCIIALAAITWRLTRNASNDTPISDMNQPEPPSQTITPENLASNDSDDQSESITTEDAEIQQDQFLESLQLGIDMSNLMVDKSYVEDLVERIMNQQGIKPGTEAAAELKMRVFNRSSDILMERLESMDTKFGELDKGNLNMRQQMKQIRSLAREDPLFSLLAAAMTGDDLESAKAATQFQQSIQDQLEQELQRELSLNLANPSDPEPQN
ncbi:MAG: hypothetical protein AAF591_03925 [Verrucomicrobiota bacterium]